MDLAVIIDLYIDEPAGLGVPPYLGTLPRYVYGALDYNDYQVKYLTIDDIRFYYNYDCTYPKVYPNKKTPIHIKNLTKNYERVDEHLHSAQLIAVIGGSHTPGKYLSAKPGRIKEIRELLRELGSKHRVLIGPLASDYGSSYLGGRHDFADTDYEEYFDEINNEFIGINKYPNLRVYSVKGAELLAQIDRPVVVELETATGCTRDKGCSFCTEPLKSDIKFRQKKYIFREAKALKEYGAKYFRIGKQSCFYSYQNSDPEEIEWLLKNLQSLDPEVLHIDNVNPNKVTSEAGERITKLITKYCTPGNIASFGVESFDPKVIDKNNLNTTPQNVLKAVERINEYGSERGENGLPQFLPGINLLLGLIGEDKETLDINYQWLKRILDSGLKIRRINIRKVVPFKGTQLNSEVGNKYLRKNKSYYYKFKERIRENIDHPMLKRILPEGSKLSNVYAEIWDGRHTFGRQFGSYPLIVGINERYELNKFYKVKIVGHQLRSVTGRVLDDF